jgi:hypothetical protein
MRISALCSGFIVALACAAADGARADEIDVVDARLAASEEGLLLSAVVEFEMSRSRWWWFDEDTASRQTQWRLSYHALSRQFRLSSGALHQYFATLEEALEVMRRLRNWLVLERSVQLKGSQYEVAVRMRLDTAHLPRPLQVSALTNRELRLESPWKHFLYLPPNPPAGAPPSREAPEGSAR